MKQVLLIVLGVVIGIAIGLPMTAVANNRGSAKYFMDAGRTEVYVFDDQDNKCYVTDGYYSGGISCVKRVQQ